MNRLTWVFRALMVTIAGSLLITATVVAVAPRVWGLANAHEEVPIELPDFSAVSQRSTAYDNAGNRIAMYELENSQPIKIDKLPEHVISAFVAVEDAEFFDHHGVNVRGLFRATLSNFAADGPTQGASTITMQVVKNDYLAGLERNGRYKLVQIAYAIRLEKQKSKREILERYLNTVFFGQNSYGINAAAETYFGKPAKKLTLIEASFLAGLVQAPSSYDPIIQPERSRTRFNYVLSRLVDLDMITEAEREEVDNTFVLPERVRRRDDSNVTTTHYSQAVRDYLLNRTDILGDTYEERYTRLYRGGLKIYSTIDPELQAIAEEARTTLPENSAGIDAALTTIENSTGAVKAMVGGAPWKRGENELNLALAESQTGSSIKLFILAAAIQAGAEADDLIDGTKGCSFPTSNPDKPFVLTSGSGRDGVNDLRVQTANSVNCAYIRLSMVVGLNRMVDTVYRLAQSPYLYKGQSPAEHRPIEPTEGTFAIGANEMSTLDMASGLQSIANQGIHMEPYLVERIEDADGNTIYTHEPAPVRVLDKDAALTTIDVLRGPPSVGTARQVLSEMSKRRPIIGKTGTQQSNWTAWYVGATPELSTAVLVRDPDRYTEMRSIPEFAELWTSADKVQGGTYPAMIWKALMDKTGLENATADWPAAPAPYREPARLYLPGQECVYKIVDWRYTSSVVQVGGGSGAGFANPAAVTQNASPALSPSAVEPPTEPEPPTEETPPPEDPEEPNVPQTSIRVSRTPVYGKVDTGTTVPPDVLDPNAPMPSVPLSASVRNC